MKKLIISFLLIVLAAPFLLAQDNGGRSYCAGSGNCDEYISRVTIGSINNSTGCNHYGNYTSLSTSLPSSGSESITVGIGTPYGGDIVGAWIDWNQDGLFNESMITFTGTPYTQFTGSITVPPEAIAGATCLRVRMQYTGTLLPCGTTSYGEVEDYTVVVPVVTHPEITVDPLAVSTIIAGSNSTSQETVKISNTGDADLDWNAGISCDVVENHCLEFNGVNQYVHVDQAFPSFNQYTLEFWRYSGGVSTTGWPRMITMFQNPDHSGDCIVIEHRNLDQNTLEITVNDGIFNNYKAYIDVSVYQNQWVHFAMTYNGSMTTFYINGQVIDNKSNMPATFSIQATQIGGCALPLAGLYRYFNGRLDEIRFWNVARTQQQIQDCKDSTFCEPQAGMMAYWKLNENSGSVITDETGNMASGIIENGAVWFTPGAPLNNDCIPPVLAPVVNILPVSGTIPPGGFADINLTFHSGDMPPGIYNSCNLFINSNDPAESKITVPLSVTIAPAQAVPVSDWAVALGIVLMVVVSVIWWRRR
jgi:hypothetical protein